MGKADLHIHTTFGDGTATVRQIMDYVRDETDLNVIALTDHDDLRAGQQGLELAGAYPFEVIPGMEITTLQGHLLALFLEKPVKMLRSVEWTLQAVHDQGGICIAPHPLSWLTRSLGERAMRRVHDDPHPEIQFDAVEVINPSLAGRVTAAKIKSLNDTDFHLAETGSSDAHHLAGVGSAYTEFDGTSALDLRRSITAKSSGADGKFEWQREMTGLMKARSEYRFRKYVLRQS
jgi:predicted metal-dependent phosphoesterase TrpH